MDTTCNHTLYAMTDVFNEFFPQLSLILLPDMLAQFRLTFFSSSIYTKYNFVSCDVVQLKYKGGCT
jgi:hypothetical protein